MEEIEKMLKKSADCGKILTVQDGFLICPTCRRNRRLMQIRPDAMAFHVVAYCRDCKTEHIVNIVGGQCFESRSQ